jgi:hypothetical protein
MFIDEIKRINNNKEAIKEFYKNNQERFESNKQKLSTDNEYTKNT